MVFPEKKVMTIENFFFLYTHRNDGLSKVKRERNFVFLSIKEWTGHGHLKWEMPFDFTVTWTSHDT
jgi:hypothetical protein